MKKTIEITNGPSREELFDGLRLFSGKKFIPFCFKMNNVERFTAVSIRSIEAEDGSGQSWNVSFFVKEQFLSDNVYVDKPERKESGVYSKKINFDFFKHCAEEDYLIEDFKKNCVIAKAYYSTKTRQGVISID